MCARLLGGLLVAALFSLVIPPRAPAQIAQGPLQLSLTNKLDYRRLDQGAAREEAFRNRVANRLAPIGESLNNAVEMARKIAARPPAAVQAIKRMLTAGINSSTSEAESYERSIFPSLWAAEEHHELVEFRWWAASPRLLQ